MAHKRLSWFIVLCISVTTCHNQATNSRSDGCCPKEVSNDVIDLTKRQSILNETECNSQCNTSDSCIGFYWWPNSTHGYECWLKTYTRMKNGKHFSLVNCDDGNLTYCWKFRPNVHQRGGVKKTDIKNESACKKHCVVDCNCIGVDWNVNNSECYVLLTGQNPTRFPNRRIHHWIIVRNALRTTCTTYTGIAASADTNATLSNSTDPESPTENSSPNSTPTATHSRPTQCMRQDILNIVLGASLGVWTLAIIGISVCCTVNAKKYSLTQKEIDKAKVDEVEMVKEAKVNNVYETREGDDESYIDYEDLTRRNCANIRQEEDCEYTAMELENMKNIEDEDDVYCNEIQ